MRLSPQRMFIPLLVSFSITGAGVVLLYFINKKKDEKNLKNKQKSEQKSIELEIPRSSVPLVIGRGGSVIQNIQESTNTKISFKEDSDVNSPARTCVITGDLQDVISAEEKIKCVLNSQPIIETYEKWVPQRTIFKITERNGLILNQIQNSSNAKVILDSSTNTTDLDAKRRVIIKGTAEQIATCLVQIEDRIREDNESKAKTESSSLNRVSRVKTSPSASPDEPPKDTDYSKEVFNTQNGEGMMDIFVSAVETPSQFYIQVISDTNAKLDDLVKEMTEYYEIEENKELHTLREITVGQTVAAQFSSDKKWYRAEIISDLGNGTYDVYFVDFGDREKVDGKNILELRTDFLSLRFQAIECSLSGVKPKTGEWSTEAIEKFTQLCSVENWQPRIAKIRGYKERVLGYGPSRREGSPIPSIELYEQRDEQLFNINKELIKLDLAIAESEPWSAASSTISLSRRAKSPEVISPPSNGTNNSSKQSFEEIDLTVTPKSKSGSVELIDLTTPSPVNNQRNESSRSFLENERNGGSNKKPRPSNPFMKNSKTVVRNIVPAGFEDEQSGEESDEFDFS